MKKYATELGIEKFVDFRDVVTRKELIELYSSCTMVCLPSVYEPFGLTVLEGAGCGKPVITTTNSGASEIVDNWKNAVVVRPGDSKDLAAAMLKLLRDKNLRKTIGENAIDLAKKYSWKLAAEETMKVYKELDRK